MLVPRGSLPSLPLSPVTQDNSGLPSGAPQPSPSTTLWAVVGLSALPEAVGFAVFILVSLSLTLDLTKSMATVSPVGGMRGHIWMRALLPCWAQTLASTERRLPWCEGTEDGFGGDQGHLPTSRKTVWFRCRSPDSPEGSLSLSLDTRESDARLFPGDHFAQPCNSTLLRSRVIKGLAQGPWT